MAKTYAVDLDATLAYYEEGNYRPGVIGRPIPQMVENVRRWLSDGITVVIFTARVAGGGDHSADIEAINMFTKENFGEELRITATKERRFDAIYDDKAHHVVKNTGEIKSVTLPYTTTAIL